MTPLAGSWPQLNRAPRVLARIRCTSEQPICDAAKVGRVGQELQSPCNADILRRLQGRRSKARLSLLRSPYVSHPSLNR